MKNLAWGIQGVIPDNAIAGFGARAILSRGCLDFPPDRRGFFCSDGTREAFIDWMETVAMPYVEEKAKRMRGNEDVLHALDDRSFHIRFNAQASHGYLYITAWMDQVP